MDIMLKCAAIALMATVMCLLIKRTNPEMSMLLSAGAIVVILTAAMGFARSITELAAMVKTMSDDSDVMIVPVLKCVGIGAVTKISAELCRDASQSSAAAAVDMAGTLCAIGVSMPLIVSMLKLIGGMT